MWNDTDLPLGYLITFRSYGTWLHGDERGSIDRFHNRYKAPYLPRRAAKPDRALNAFKAYATRRMRQDGNWPETHSPWADKGSKRGPWNERSLSLAIDYVINGQGEELPDLE